MLVFGLPAKPQAVAKYIWYLRTQEFEYVSQREYFFWSNTQNNGKTKFIFPRLEAEAAAD